MSRGRSRCFRKTNQQADERMKRGEFTMSLNTVRLGLIGAGRWGRNIIQDVGRRADIRLVAVASRNYSVHRLVGDGCAVVDDWRRLIDRDDLDGLIVAVPAACQPEIAATAIAAGLPLLVDKPLTRDVGAAERLYAEALRRQRLVMVDHQYLHHPAYEEMKTRLSEFGPIAGLTSIGGGWGPFRWDEPVIWEWGAHEVAMALDLIGMRPTTIAATSSRREATADGFGEIVRLSLNFTGCRATATCGNLMREPIRRLTVSTQDHAAVFDDLAPSRLILLRRGEGGRAEAIAVDDEPPLHRMIERFTGAIRAGTCDLSSLALSVDVVRVLAAAASALIPKPQTNVREGWSDQNEHQLLKVSCG